MLALAIKNPPFRNRDVDFRKLPALRHHPVIQL